MPSICLLLVPCEVDQGRELDKVNYNTLRLNIAPLTVADKPCFPLVSFDVSDYLHRLTH